MDVEYVKTVRRRLYNRIDSIVCRVDRSVSESYVLFLYTILLKAYCASRSCKVACRHLEPVELVALSFVFVNDVCIMSHDSFEIGIRDVLFLVADNLKLVKASVEFFLAEYKSEFFESLPYRMAAGMLSEHQIVHMDTD